MPRILPSAPEAEATLLGNMMVYPAAARIAMEEGLSEEDFFSEANRRIFLAIDSLYKQGSPIDLTTVVTRLADMDLLDKCGGLPYLTDLSDAAVTSANVKSYVEMVHDKAVIRKMIEATETLAEEGYSGQTDINEYLDACEKAVLEISRNRRTSEFRNSPELMTEVLANIQKMSDNKTDITGLKTGFNDFDHTLHGLQKGDLIVLAARPAIGKTAFALNMARNAAVDHHMPVAVFSLEMSAVQLTKRLMTSESGLPADKIKGGTKLEPFEWEQLDYKLRNLSKAPLYIDDTPSIPVMEFRTKVKNLVKSKGVRLVVVDYLQLMQGPAELRGMREQEVAAISRTLKQTAKELDVPIIALSQLSRQTVQRSGGSGRPQLSDLRESGSIEQDADMVIFIHRPDALGLSADPAGKEETQIIIAKHRNGSVGEIPMIFKSEQIRFMEQTDSLDVRAASIVASGINGSPSDDFPNNPF